MEGWGGSLSYGFFSRRRSWNLSCWGTCCRTCRKSWWISAQIWGSPVIFSIVALVNGGECKSHYPLSTSNFLDRIVPLLKKLIVWGLEIPAILEFAMCSQFHISTAGFGSFEFPRPPKHQQEPRMAIQAGWLKKINHPKYMEVSVVMGLPH